MKQIWKLNQISSYRIRVHSRKHENGQYLYSKLATPYLAPIGRGGQNVQHAVGHRVVNIRVDAVRLDDVLFEGRVHAALAVVGLDPRVGPGLHQHGHDDRQSFRRGHVERRLPEVVLTVDETRALRK